MKTKPEQSKRSSKGLPPDSTLNFPRTKLKDVVGSLRSTGKTKTLSEMDDAIEEEVKRRHESGRY